MANLLWPGDERAGSLMSDAAVLAAMVQVEQAWLDALVEAGLAPSALDLTGLVGPDDVAELAVGAESGGNPVIDLVAMLRRRAVPPGGAESDAWWIHRGLTSQDVVDSALALGLRDALDRVDDEVRTQLETLERLVASHRATAMVGRTLTQQAVPTTFGLVAAGWTDALVAAGEDVRRARDSLAAQVGGAAGTLAASTEVARLRGADDPAATSVRLAERTAAALGLAWAPPWHVDRGRVTRVGDALVTASDAWGHVATDVATLSRPEIGELAEPAADGRGGSSTMPNKRNPVLSVLVRRAALAAPGLGATLHTASALAVDQRPDGPWHAEWETVRTLARRTVVAASQVSELLAGLEVRADRMRANLAAAGRGVLAERDGLRRVLGNGSAAGDGSDAGADGASYLGASDALIDAVLTRVRTYLKETP